MADNTTLDTGSGGDVIATDDIAGVKHQRVKVQYGVDGAATDVSDSNPLPIDDAGGSLTVDNGGTFAVQVDASLPAGSNAIGKLAANSGVDIGDVDVTSLDGVAVEGAALGNGILVQGDDGTDRKNINVDATTGDVQVDVTNTVTVDGSGVTQPVSAASLPLPSGAATAANQLAVTSGGTTLYKNIDVDESEDQVKGSAGQVYWVHAINLKATPLFLKFYNATAASVTVGTTVPDLTFPVPSAGDTNGAGFTLSIPNGVAFGTAITIAATTGVADNDSGAPGANELIVNLGYA